MTAVVDHFNVFIVCAMESELQATKGVLENGTGSKFENKYLRVEGLSTLNVRMCEKWNSTEMKVGMVAQTQMGGIECQKLVSKLAKYFTANVLVMTGICAGDENKYGHVEHGCVFVANRTTVESGGKVTEGGAYQPRAQYCVLDGGIHASVNELVTGPNVWLEYIPKNAIRPSPRYLQQLILELILDIVSKSGGEDGITKKDLLGKLTDMKLPGMTTMDDYDSAMIYDGVLERMLQQKSPWVSRTVKSSYIATDEGKKYSAGEYPFPRKDKIKAITDCMVSIPHVNLNLKEELKTIKERVGDRKVKAVDMEAHMFMEQAIEIFARQGVPGKAIVMKGIADYGSSESRGDYFQVYAASTSAAFLRHLMTVKQHHFDPPPVCVEASGTSTQTSSSSVSDDDIKRLVAQKSADDVKKLIVQNVSGRYFEIADKLGWNRNQIANTTALLPNNDSKLTAIIAEEVTKVGKKVTLERVLKACRDLDAGGFILEA